MAEEKPLSPKADGSLMLFYQVTFLVIESESLPNAQAQGIRQKLQEYGATQHPHPSDYSKAALEGLTHIISTTVDFEYYDAVTDQMVSVVKPSWVTSSVHKGRLANPRSHSPDPRLFFSGLVLCVADLPEGDKDAIIGGVLAMGGLYSAAVSRLVTHIVALSQESSACSIAMIKNLDCKMVLPHWFDDCLRLGRRINEAPYLLPDPEILRADPCSHVKNLVKPDLQGSISVNPDQQIDLPVSPRKRHSVFKDHKILLSKDLDISDHLRQTLADLIQKGKGQVTDDINESDTLVCQYREGAEFRAAGSQGKTVGNLSWLYQLIRQNSWTSPMKRLLHYPIAREGLPGFKKFRISLSNYNGESRIYLENLAKAAGCEFTKTMKMDNTHLITAHTKSEKCDAAREWNINMVNHLWLEESYAKWQIQSLANPRYVHFPARTNLGEVVGQTPIDKKALENFFFAKGSNNASHAAGHHDQVAHAKGELPRSGNESSTLLETANLTSRSRSVAHETENDKKQSKTPCVTGKDQDERRSVASMNPRTPGTLRISISGKENETPSTGSRSAKEKAAVRLHDMSSDIALYEKERKRVGGVIFGGRRSGGDLVRNESLKRSALEDSEESIGCKRTKKNKPVSAMELLVTGYTKWARDPKSFAKDKDRLRQLGINLTDNCASCKFVAAPKIMRTRKFVCAMAQGPFLVSIDFVEQCLAENKLLKPENFPLADPDGEERYRMKLPEAIARAKNNGGRLLANQSIYATENVHGGFDTYRAIVEANGGKCVLFKGRPGLKIADGGNDKVQKEDGVAYLISGVTPTEAKLWHKFRSSVGDAGKLARVVKTDWMLDLALSQEVRWDESYALTENDVTA